MANYKYHPMRFLSEEHGLKISASTTKYPNIDLGVTYTQYMQFLKAVRGFLDQQASEKKKGTWDAKRMSEGARAWYKRATDARRAIAFQEGLGGAVESFLKHVLDGMRDSREESFLRHPQALDTFIKMDTPMRIVKHGHLGVDRMEDARTQQQCRVNLAQFRHLWKHRVEVNRNLRVNKRNQKVARSTKFKIPKAPFARMTRNTVDAINNKHGGMLAQRMTRDALEMLQIYVEHSLVKHLKCVDVIATHGKVKTVSEKHVHVLRAVQDALGISTGM